MKPTVYRTAEKAHNEISRLEALLDVRRRNGIERGVEPIEINPNLMESAEFSVELLKYHRISSTELNPRLSDSYHVVDQALRTYKLNGELDSEDLRHLKRVILAGYEFYNTIVDRTTKICKAMGMID